MKKSNKTIVGLAFLLSLLICSLIFVDFLALSDISKDYVSTKVLESIGVDLSDKLPDWSATELEWGFIKISLILKAVCMIVIVIALGKTIKMLKA